MKSKGETIEYFVYILKNSSGNIYIGQTTNIDNRLKRHNNATGALYTKYKVSFQLVYAEKFTTLKDAMNRELQIKKWSRSKKEALIAGDLIKLKKL